MCNSKKLNRVVKSAMAAETLNQVKTTKACFWLANLLSEILWCKLNDDKNENVLLTTISNYMILYTTRLMQDKHLQTETALLREITNKKDISKINWIEHKYQIADYIAKYGASSKKILNTPKTKSVEFL